MSALASMLGRSVPAEAQETALIFELSQREPEIQKAALRAIFNVGGLFASSMGRYYRREWTMEEAARLAAFSGSPCFGRPWKQILKSESSETLGVGSERYACAEGLTQSFHCEYWKDALEGLLSGLSGSLYLSRHENGRNDARQCLDWIYPTRESPLKFGPLPDDLKALVTVISERFERAKVVLRVWGLSEGNLYYQMDSALTGFCGPGKRLFEGDFKKAVAVLYPQLGYVDVTPRAVLPEEAG